MAVRSVFASGAVVALLVGACASSTLTPAVPESPGFPAASAATAPADAGSDGPARSAGSVATELPEQLLAAIASRSLEGLSTAEASARAAIDERTGFAAIVGPELLDWLAEQRSTAVQEALQSIGIDPSTLGPIAGGGLVASIDGGLTAAATGSFGAGMAAAGLVSGGVGHIGGQFTNGGTSSSQSERTQGDRHVSTSTTTVMQLNVSGSLIVADADITETDTATSVSTGAALGTATTRSHIHVEAQMCPDANGGLPINITADDSSGVAPGGSSFTSTTTGTRQVTVGEDAEVASDTSTLDSSFEEAANGARRSGTAQASWTGGAGPSLTGSSFTSQGDFTPAEAGALQGVTSSTLAALGTIVLDKARDAWQGGRCVELTATEGTRTVRTNEVVEFTVQPKHLIEHTDLSKPVVAAFTGKASLDPVGVPVDAPALFTFTAGPVHNDRGTVDLTTTSNRGIGRLSITFTVEALGWYIDDESARGTVKGKKCGEDPIDTWKANGTYSIGGFNGKQRWTIRVTDTEMRGNVQIWTGTYTYSDRSTGPYGVHQDRNVDGSVRLAVNPDNGDMFMNFKELEREQRAWTDSGGEGYARAPTLPPFDWTWSANAGC